MPRPDHQQQPGGGGDPKGPSLKSWAESRKCKGTAPPKCGGGGNVQGDEAKESSL